MKRYLCYCTYCGTIMIDENPSNESIILDVPECANDMMVLEDVDGSVCVCPNCNDDSYLIDITSKKQLNKLIHT